MGLLIAGILEALIAILVGLYLLSSSNVPHMFAGVAFGVGLVVLILTLLLGRKSRGRVPEVDDKRPEPEDAGLPAPVDGVGTALDHSALAALSNTEEETLPELQHGGTAALSSADGSFLATQSLLHDVVLRSRWRYRAREAETRAATLAELVLHEGSRGDAIKDERPRQLRRLCDLAILSQGFDAWANGEAPSFRLDRYVKAHTTEELDDRILELRREKEALEAESLHWADILADYEDPYRRSLAERMRFEKLRDLEERMEEILLLEMGYDTMRVEEAP